MMGQKQGENAQVLALGEALGWPFEIKRLVYTPYEMVVNLPVLNTLAGVVESKSSPLTAPWPDIVISAGRRNEPVCRWIRQTADKPVRLVHLGRPWASCESFDLVITTPQYRLPEHPKVLQNELPLHRVTDVKLAQEAAKWALRLAHLPRPYITVLAGGHSGPHAFDKKAGRRLARRANAMAAETGGSILVTTSARTPKATADALLSAIDRPAFTYRWSPDSIENPFYGLLALADTIVVTGDSVSMIAEACATGKPVYLFDTDEGRASMRASASDFTSPVLDRFARRWRKPAHLMAFIYRQAMQLAPRRLTRDLRLVHEMLVSSGRVAWLDEPIRPKSPSPFPDRQRAVARVRGLLDPVGARRPDLPPVPQAAYAYGHG
jgi:mitochondrial fission protein ELM1